MKRPYLVVLKAGPTYKLSDYIAGQAAALSERLEGEFWTSGPVDLDEQIGSFRIRCMRVPEAGKFRRLGRLAHMVRCVALGIRVAARVKGQCLVFVSYDPFRNGLVALILKSVTGAKFICEVNGVYGRPEYLSGGETSWRTKVKFQFRRRFASAIVNRADGVRLLFAEQLAGLNVQLHESKVRCYFDAVQLERFSDLGSEKTVLFLGHPFWLKGVDVLLSGFERLQDEFPDWSLVIIGHEMPDEVARRRPAIRRLTVLRAMPNAEVAHWIGRAGVVVLPSRSEAMGRVLIEAAAARKARIATRVGGTYTVVRDGVDGLLVPPDDSDALASALRKLMGSEALRRHYGEAAYANAVSKFSAVTYATAVCEFVEFVCTESHATVSQ
jgi:glycosyltransferase involved in cell wall biosynthesis